jgi:hypothetical protein
MEILQIVARPLSARFVGQDFRFSALFPTSMNFGEVLKEKPSAVKQRNQGSIMIDRKRINPGFDVGEVLQKKGSHIGVDLISIRDRQIGARTTPRFLTFLPTRGLSEPAQGETVPNIPSDPWQLASTIG